MCVRAVGRRRRDTAHISDRRVDVGAWAHLLREKVRAVDRLKRLNHLVSGRERGLERSARESASSQAVYIRDRPRCDGITSGGAAFRRRKRAHSASNVSAREVRGPRMKSSRLPACGGSASGGSSFPDAMDHGMRTHSCSKVCMNDATSSGLASVIVSSVQSQSHGVRGHNNARPQQQRRSLRDPGAAPASPFARAAPDFYYFRLIRFVIPVLRFTYSAYSMRAYIQSICDSSSR